MYKKRVVLLVTEMCSNGGIQSFMKRISEVMIQDQEYEACCFSLNDSTEELKLLFGDENSIKLWGANSSKMRFISKLLVERKKIETIIVGHVSLAPLAMTLRLRGLTSRYYVQLHGIEVWRTVSFLQRLSLRNATGILATTQYTANICAQKNNLKSANFKIIPLCVGESSIKPNDNFRLNGEVKLLCVARQEATERYKGFEMIFEALIILKKTHSGIHLNLVGVGNDQKRLITITKQMNVDANVTFWGKLSEENLSAVYQECDLFVMPSKAEGFGIVFLEAMRFGKPCIGGNHGGTPDVIEHGQSGFLVEYGDVTKLAEYICALANSPFLREKMGKIGLELIESKFSMKSFQNSYEKLCLDL